MPIDGASVPLGFEVNTTGLAQGKVAAASLTEALNRVAEAMSREEVATRKSAAAAVDAAANTIRLAQAERDQALAALRSAEASTKASDADRKAAEEALKAAAAKLRAVEAAERKRAADARAAEEARRLAEAQARATTEATRYTKAAETAAGAATTLASSFAMASATIGGGNMIGGLTGGFQAASGAAGRLGSSLGGARGAAIAGAGAFAALTAATVGLITVTGRQQEAFAMLEARLANVYGSAAIAQAAFADITDLADKNALSIQATAESFLRLARNNEAIGLTRDEMVDLTDAVQMLGRVSGASNGELQSGLLQFSQALAAGRLNGDELRSIMENMPALTKAIADGLGVSVGQLRAMGAEGQLTSDKIVGALLGQLPDITEEFENLPQTSEQAFTRISNAWDRLLSGMGERLNSSQLVSGWANGVADNIEMIAGVVTPQTDAERLEELQSVVRELERLRAIPRGSMEYNGMAISALERQVQLDEVERIGLFEAQRALAFNEERSERTATLRAPFVRSGAIAQEIDDVATKAKKLEEQIRALEAAYASFQEDPSLFEPQEAERLAQYPGFIAALNTQLNSIRPVLDDYAVKTERMLQDLARYGAGGAAAIGDEARGLVSQAAKAGQNISFDDAEAAVIDRRIAQITTQTQAMDSQITVAMLNAAAIRGGTEAQIEAEVATKTLNLQLELFGTEIGPDAAAALEEYSDRLESLLRIQREVTDGQRLYNAEVEAGIQAQINAAIAAGRTQGEVDALRRNLETMRDLNAAGAGGAVPALVPVPGNGVIPQDRVDGNTVISGLQPDITSIVSSVMATYPEIMGISGVRAGDDGSQHQLGRAFDLDLSGLDESERRALVAQLLAGSYGRIGGIGTYNDQATSLHIDTREGRYAWGPNSSRTSLGETPDWFEDMARAWMAGEDPVVPAPQGLTNPTLEQQAILIEADTAEARAQQGDLTRLQSIAQETAAIIESMTAPDAVARREAEITRAADQAAATATPAMADDIRAAEIARLRAEDEAAYQNRLRALEEETALLNDQADLAGLPRREREIELETLRQINEELAAGRDVDAERAQEIRIAVANRFDASEAREQAEEAAGAYREIWETAAQGIGSSLESAVATAARRGKIEADKLLADLVADIAVAITRAYVTKPLVDGIGTFIDSFAAHGAAYDGGVRVFASGGVVDRPTLFPMARGAGLMGEAGPEAVLPLKRGPDGRLGVGAGPSGGNTSVIINDMRSASGAEPVEVEETRGPDGERMLQIMIRDEMNRQFGTGGVDKAMRNNYGVTRQITRR